MSRTTASAPGRLRGALVSGIRGRPVPAAAATTAVLVPAIVALVALRCFTVTAAPVDFDLFGPHGADLLTGRWSAVYSDPNVQAGPFELAVFGVAQLMGIVDPLRWTIFLTGAAALSTFVCALLLRPEGAPARRASAIAALGCALLLAGPIVTSWTQGHPAELAIPLCWVLGGRFARRGSPAVAAVLVAASSGFEVWGILGAPVILLAPRIRPVRTVSAATIGLVAIWAPLVLAGPFRMGGYAWPVGGASLLHLLWPRMTEVPWGFRVAQAVLAVGAGSAAALLARRPSSRAAVWAVPAVIVAARLSVDPVLFGYYWAPVVLGVTGLTCLALASRRLDSVAFSVSCLLICALPFLPALRASAVAAILLAAAVLLCRRRRTPLPRAALRA